MALGAGAIRRGVAAGRREIEPYSSCFADGVRHDVLSPSVKVRYPVRASASRKKVTRNFSIQRADSFPPATVGVSGPVYVLAFTVLIAPYCCAARRRDDEPCAA